MGVGVFEDCDLCLTLLWGTKILAGPAVYAESAHDA